MFCRCWKVTSFNPNSTFSTNRAQKQVTTIHCLHDHCHFKYSFKNNFKSLPGHYIFIFILNFLSVLALQFFHLHWSRTPLLWEMVLGRRRTLSVLQYRKKMEVWSVYCGFPWHCYSKAKVCFLFPACFVSSLDLKFFGIELWFLNWNLRSTWWMGDVHLLKSDFFLQKNCLVLLYLTVLQL